MLMVEVIHDAEKPAEQTILLGTTFDTLLRKYIVLSYFRSGSSATKLKRILQSEKLRNWL